MPVDSVIVFLTGCPGCGKTFFAQKILKKFPFFVLSSYDTLKEEYFDKYGFNSLEERAELNKQSLTEYYKELSDLMEKRLPILTDYPFNRLVHEDDLKSLVEKYNYKAITITLFGSPEVLLERGTKRDKTEDNRNPGHYLTSYHKDNYSESNRIPVMSLEKFIETINHKDYFMQIGKAFSIDVTDFSKIDYESVFKAIEESI